jgi:hypothetical protein
MKKSMKRRVPPGTTLVLFVALVTLLALPAPAYAHCDTMDGPVVLSAQEALETGELEPLLIWVRPQDEAEVRHAYEHVQKVRGLGGDAAALADRYFFETVVRVHREGEGAPYTGLKPAGTDLGQGVPATDRSLETGSSEELRHLLHRMVDARLNGLYNDALGKRAFERNDVAAGRAYVDAYVQLMHFVEELEAIAGGRGHEESGARENHTH